MRGASGQNDRSSHTSSRSLQIKSALSRMVSHRVKGVFVCGADKEASAEGSRGEGRRTWSL